MDGIIDSMDMSLNKLQEMVEMSLNKLQEMVKDREAWRASAEGVSKSQARVSD